MIYIPNATSSKLFDKLPELFLHARQGQEVLLQFHDCVYRLSLAGINSRIDPNGNPEKIDRTKPASFSTPPLAFPKPNPKKG